MIIEWSFGFHRPHFRNLPGKVDPRGWLGHCEAWGYTEDQTWLFIDPQGMGTRMRVMHRHDDVMDQLEARYALCSLILTLPATDPAFRFPLHGPLTCASICGNLVGIRALLPSGLRRKLRAKGARISHEAQRRPSGQSSADA